MKAIIRKLKRLTYTKVFALFSLSAVAFTFQACYGMPQDDWVSVDIKGYVNDSQTREPIPGIRVRVDGNGSSAYTDAEGFFVVRAEPDSVYTLNFTDVDGEDNGLYWDKTASLSDTASMEELSFKVLLNPKVD